MCCCVLLAALDDSSYSTPAAGPPAFRFTVNVATLTFGELAVTSMRSLFLSVSRRSVTTSNPQTRADPDAGVVSVVRAWIVIVFPAPL